MIIVRLMGGLGNQLFQYAAARSLAERHSSDFRIDLSWYADQSERHFQLDEFCLKAKLAKPWDYLHVNPELGLSRIVQSLVGRRWPGLLKRLEHWSGLKDVYRPGSVGDEQRKLLSNGVASQRFFHFDPDFFDLPKNVYLSGFWQSYRYFENVRPALLQEIELKHALNSECISLVDKMRAGESVSIHVRRGDKVDNEDYNATDLEYVARALCKIEERVNHPVYYVFTDDLEWVKRHLDIGKETIFVGTEANITDCEELMMMSMCRHNIIAESSFSWWGAWLNGNQDKVVISPSPERWINAGDYCKQDLLPDGWLVV